MHARSAPSVGAFLHGSDFSRHARMDVGGDGSRSSSDEFSLFHRLSDGDRRFRGRADVLTERDRHFARDFQPFGGELLGG